MGVATCAKRQSNQVEAAAKATSEVISFEGLVVSLSHKRASYFAQIQNSDVDAGRRMEMGHSRACLDDNAALPRARDILIARLSQRGISFLLRLFTMRKWQRYTSLEPG